VTVDESDQDDLPQFSLQQKMHLSLNDSTRLFKRTEAIITGGLAFLAIALAVSYLFYTVIDLNGEIIDFPDCSSDAFRFDNFEYNPTEGCYNYNSNFGIIPVEKFVGLLYLFHQTSDGLIVLVMLMLGGLAIWWFVKGKKIKNRMIEIKKQYLNNAYHYILQTSTHEISTVAEDFFDIAIEIFPELKNEEIKSLKKTGKELEIQTQIFEDQGNYELDIEQKTKEGYFLIKYFKQDTVTFIELEGFLKIIKKNYKDDDIFRIVCLAKSFDDTVSKKI